MDGGGLPCLGHSGGSNEMRLVVPEMHPTICGTVVGHQLWSSLVPLESFSARLYVQLAPQLTPRTFSRRDRILQHLTRRLAYTLNTFPSRRAKLPPSTQCASEQHPTELSKLSQPHRRRGPHTCVVSGLTTKAKQQSIIPYRPPPDESPVICHLTSSRSSISTNHTAASSPALPPQPYLQPRYRLDSPASPPHHRSSRTPTPAPKRISNQISAATAFGRYTLPSSSSRRSLHSRIALTSSETSEYCSGQQNEPLPTTSRIAGSFSTAPHCYLSL